MSDHPAMRFFGSTLGKKVAVILAAAVLLGQFALVLHDVVAQHELDTACEICVVKDRHTDFISAEIEVPVFLSITVAICIFSMAVPVFCRIQTARPGGPPIL